MSGTLDDGELDAMRPGLLVMAIERNHERGAPDPDCPELQPDDPMGNPGRRGV
jgi:hypothetical protein